MVIEELSLADEIFAAWKATIRNDFQGYRNHFHHMIHCCFEKLSNDETEKIIVSGAFHDIGIWIENILDYLPPSRQHKLTLKYTDWNYGLLKLRGIRYRRCLKHIKWTWPRRW